MPVETFANQPQTTVSSGGTTAPSAGSTETWTVASSSSFPAANSGATPPTRFHVADTAAGLGGEIIAVTNVSGNTWTVTRGAESTTTVAHTSGFTVVQVVSAAAYGGLLQSANNLSDVASAAAAYNTLSPMTTMGDIEYESGTNTATRLAGNTTATKNFLTQTGTGSVSAAPAWGTIASGDMPTGTTGAKGALQLDGTAADIAAPGTQAAGSIGKAADSGHVHPATFTATAYVAPAVFTLTFVGGGTTLVDASKGNSFALTLTASTSTLGSPSNSVDGQVIRIRMIQDSTGSRTIAYNAVYDFGAAGSPTLSTGASKVDILGFEYVASISKWCYLGSGLGF